MQPFIFRTKSCFTTGHSSFAECRRHSAKAILHSVKALPSATASLPNTFCRALGKKIAECHLTLDKETLGELYIGNSFFAEYFLSGTRQKICRVSFDTRQRKVTVTAPSDGDGSFVECLLWHSAKRLILPSVCYSGPRQRRVQWAPPPAPVPRALVGTRQRRLLCRVSSGLALGKESSSGPFASPFAECLGNSTRQRWLYRFPGFLLCRVPLSALGKDGFTGSQVSFFAECHGHSTRQSYPFITAFST
jgi:hypothetical protein